MDEKERLRRGGILRLGGFFLIILLLGLAMVVLTGRSNDIAIDTPHSQTTAVPKETEALPQENVVMTLQAEIATLEARIGALETQQGWSD